MKSQGTHVVFEQTEHGDVRRWMDGEEEEEEIRKQERFAEEARDRIRTSRVRYLIRYDVATQVRLRMGCRELYLASLSHHAPCPLSPHIILQSPRDVHLSSQRLRSPPAITRRSVSALCTPRLLRPC